MKSYIEESSDLVKSEIWFIYLFAPDPDLIKFELNRLNIRWENVFIIHQMSGSASLPLTSIHQISNKSSSQTKAELW